MSQNNPIQGYTWEEEDRLEDNSSLNRSIADEVISIYEVYVKEDCQSQDGRAELSLVSTESDNSHLITEDIHVLEDGITDDAEVDDSASKFLGKILNEEVNKKEEKKVKSLSGVHYSQTNSENSTTVPQIIDKDDPRSRLHFVKYLKRDGKTIKIWECGICSKEFRHQYTLMRHLPTHTDERNFKCDACGKAFRQLSTLSQHKAIHSDARPYVCEYCKKTFNRVSTLISHRKTHSENKPHKCPICGKGFHQKGNLRNHVFTHTNERPYKCETCGKGFNQMSNLVCHKVKAHAHTERMQYSCGICGKEFPRRFSLRAHEESKHGIKYRNTSATQNGGNEAIKIKKNLKIIELSSEDSMEVDDKENTDSSNIESFLIDKINTKAMIIAQQKNQVPFALFKPIRGIPVLVKVTDGEEDQHMLTPATPEDLRINGTITSPESSYCDGEKGQMKISVVATVTQKLESNGEFSFSVEPPDSDEDHVENFLIPKMEPASDKTQSYAPECESTPSMSTSMDDCNELLELAAQGGIQFVRATEDGRYEVMSNTEARDLMAQNSHDVTILEGPEAEAISVMQANTRSTSEDVIIGDSENQIMVLDVGANQKSLDTIEILDTSGLAFFGQSKIDDFIVGQRGGYEGIPITSEDDLMTPHDFTSILHHQQDLCTPHPSFVSNQEAFSYFKNSRLTTEDFNILGIDNNYLDDNKIKHDFDEVMNDIHTQLTPINSDIRTIGGIQGGQKFDALPSFGDTKALGPKYQEFEAASQYHDIKIFNNCDQGLRNLANNYSYSSDITDSNYQINGLRLFGKKLFDELQEDVREDKAEESFLKQNSSSSRSLPTFPDNDDGRQIERTITDQYLLQGSVLSDPDFLNFEGRSVESPGGHLSKSFILDGLPDLN